MCPYSTNSKSRFQNENKAWLPTKRRSLVGRAPGRNERPLGLSAHICPTCCYVRPCISLNISNWPLKLDFRFFGPYKAGPCLKILSAIHLESIIMPPRSTLKDLITVGIVTVVKLTVHMATVVIASVTMPTVAMRTVAIAMVGCERFLWQRLL